MDDLDRLLDDLAGAAIRLEEPDPGALLEVLRSPDDRLLDVVAGAARVRRHFFANTVKLNFLVNLKSGLCPEDCSYCSQRRGSQAGVLRYGMIGPEEAAAAADAAAAAGATRVCLVASGRGPGRRELDGVVAAVSEIRRRHPSLEICTSLGLLSPAGAESLAEAGVFAYNHNLNTSPRRYGEICTTHGFDDRRETVETATRAGLSPCSGAIFGMGESDEEIVEVALALRALRPDSVPVNFLMPFEGTPLAGDATSGGRALTPQRCLRILSCMRFALGGAELRIAGGRELHLRTLQPLALHVANSIFLGDYLTSEGGPGAEDLAMILEGGFVPEGAGAGQPRPAPGPPMAGERVRIRRSGPGTALPART